MGIILTIGVRTHTDLYAPSASMAFYQSMAEVIPFQFGTRTQATAKQGDVLPTRPPDVFRV